MFVLICCFEPVPVLYSVLVFSISSDWLWVLGVFTGGWYEPVLCFTDFDIVKITGNRTVSLVMA